MYSVGYIGRWVDIHLAQQTARQFALMQNVWEFFRAVVEFSSRNAFNLDRTKWKRNEKAYIYVPTALRTQAESHTQSDKIVYN